MWVSVCVCVCVCPPVHAHVLVSMEHNWWQWEFGAVLASILCGPAITLDTSNSSRCSFAEPCGFSVRACVLNYYCTKEIRLLWTSVFPESYSSWLSFARKWKDMPSACLATVVSLYVGLRPLNCKPEQDVSLVLLDAIIPFGITSLWSQ